MMSSKAYGYELGIMNIIMIMCTTEIMIMIMRMFTNLLMLVILIYDV